MADLFLHLVDITHKDAANQCVAVDEILKNLQLAHKPIISVFNKLDLVLNNETELEEIITAPHFEGEFMLPNNDISMISAEKKWGITKLLDKIKTKLYSESIC